VRPDACLPNRYSEVAWLHIAREPSGTLCWMM
jgi:hypothetical protein